jgi:hypothetical protein
MRATGERRTAGTLPPRWFATAFAMDGFSATQRIRTISLSDGRPLRFWQLLPHEIFLATVLPEFKAPGNVAPGLAKHEPETVSHDCAIHPPSIPSPLSNSLSLTKPSSLY